MEGRLRMIKEKQVMCNAVRYSVGLVVKQLNAQLLLYTWLRES